MGAVYGSLERDDDVLAIGMNRAMDLLAKKLASVRTLGPHPGDKELVSVRKGRFGPYVQHGKTVANLPRGVMMDDITLDEAVALLAEKGKPLKPRGAGARRGGRGAAAKQANRDAGAKDAAAVQRPVGAKAAAGAKAKPAKRPAARKAPAKRAAAAKSVAPAGKQAAPAAKKKAAALKKAAGKRPDAKSAATRHAAD